MSANDTTPMQLLLETPLEALGSIVRETVIIEDSNFLISRPEDSDHLLDHPLIRSAFAADEYLPYWADLWPASRMLAKAILREPWPVGADGQPLHALEIGCGLGLPGIAALSRGLRVTFSDYDATALRFASENARRNDFTNFELLQMDWRSPPANLQFPVVLGSDLVYELRHVEPVVAFIKRVLLAEGVCLLTDQDRVPAHLLRELCPAQGLTFTTQTLRAGETGGRRFKGTLYRIGHAS